jgi:parallel beta-helix repeat protein
VYKKLVSTGFLVSILACGLILVGTFHFGTVQAATNVIGIINSDTTWTKSNSPYNLTGPAGIAKGVTLKIEPGVTVNLGSYYLVVNGTLYARGSSTENIFFNPYSSTWDYSNAISFMPDSNGWNGQTGSGSVIENAVFDSVSIGINGASPKINNNTFGGGYRLKKAIAVSEGSAAIISNNTIDGAGSDSSAFSGGIGCGGNALISRNSVFGWDSDGISIDGGSPIVEGNVVTNNKGGFRVDWSRSSPVIRNNTIAKNLGGIRLLNGPWPVIVNNNIYDNTNYNLYLHTDNVVGNPEHDVSATSNWWGTTDVAKINQSIYDFNDNFNLGKVNFVPFLTAPSPGAPPIPSSNPSPTPSPSPTLSPSPTNQTITRIQSYQYGAGLGAGNEPDVQTSITLANAPIQGNVLISVIGIQGMHSTVTDAQGVVTAPLSFETATVSSINETGVVWTRQVRSNSTAFNLNVEVWLGVVVSQASPSITVNLDSLPSNMIMALTVDICEYRGIATNSSLDKTAINTGFGSTADTGLTAPTTQPNELWIGGILFESSGQQKSPTNGFLLLDGQPNATGGRVCTAFLENIVNEQGTANSGTTIKYGDEILFCAWVGCIATFSSTPVDTPTPTPSTSNGTGWDIFSVESNSTVTELAFDSISSEFTFVVHGPSGTAGYVKTTIAKSLVPNAENIRVYLDGNQLDYEVTSNTNSWLLTFTYQHSAHKVRINLTNAAGATIQGIEYWLWIGVAIILVVAGVLGFIVWRTKKKEKT